MYSEQYNDILTIDEAMDLLKIGRNHVYKLLNSGEIKGFKLGTKNWKIPKESIQQYIYKKAFFQRKE